MTASSLDAELPMPQGVMRRFARHPALMHYHRLVCLVGAINLAFLAFGVTRGMWWTRNGIALGPISNLVLVNFSIAILIRQQYVINLLFWLATRAPTHWPLSIRWTLAKVYHFGGLHSGCAAAATVWFAVFAGSLTFHLANGLPGVSVGIVWVTYALLAILLVIVLMALPAIRARFHNSFEKTHRFGGWAALLLFWTQSVMFINDQRGGAGLAHALLSSPGWWMLAVLTTSIALPWTRLRKVPVRIDTPSSHAAIVRFDHGVTPFPGSSTAVSRHPLFEWHSFANIPAPRENGFRLIVSRAGDWSGSFIDDAPSHVWVKGIPTAGVANIETLFTRVVYVATGSGIGPVLPHLLAKRVPARLVWSTRSPRETYGDALLDEILQAEPGAIIWDTDTQGKPDMVRLAYAAYTQFNAEAVICIANQKLTNAVVYGMESRGIPAYGAIWDS